MSNSRGPQSLADLIAELGPLATAGAVEQAAQAGDLVLLSVPLTAHAAVPANTARGQDRVGHQRLGFDTVDAGSLAQSWRFEPEATAYTRLYLANRSTPNERMLQAPGRPVSAAELRIALQAAQRVRVADRDF